MTKSIYNTLCDHIYDGQLSPDFSIENEHNSVPFAPGAMDGIFMYHMRNNGLGPNAVREMGKAVKTAANNDYTQADNLFFELTKTNRAIQIVDSLQQYIDRHISNINTNNLFQCALSLVLHSTHIECVKIGLEILELFRYDEQVKEIIRRLGLFDEFTLFAIWNMLKWDNGNEEIFELAQKVHGWGRIHAVERLEPLTEEIRQWLLTEGTKNEVVNSYSSLTCWTKSQAEDILFHNPTQSEFESISALINGLLDEGPVEGISALENRKQILLHYLSISPNYALSTAFYTLVMSIRQYAENKYQSLVDTCEDILHSPSCIEMIQNSADKEDFGNFNALLMN